MGESGKRICIIGGGASGVTAAKACQEEGHDYVIYEMHSTFGGLWRYRDEDVNGLASVAAATIINSSKEMSAFSDFPPRAEYPNYMHNTRMVEYIEDYARHIGCEQRMRFQHKVLSVEKAASFELDGKWRVTVEDMRGGRQLVEEFAGVMVCTGHHVTPAWASFPGQELFKGQILHTHSYKRPAEFANKRVVVVGIGNSGGDVAVELSMINPLVHLSTRRGAWVVHRVGPMGKPFDTLFLRRWINVLFNTMPYRVVCSTAENFINCHFDHAQYRIKPEHRIFEQHITVNDALPNRVLSGTIQLKNDIERITETGVVFKGDQGRETACDVIIMATGYRVDFPFIDQSLVPVCDNKVDLYKYVFAPNLQPHPETLAFIALAQPIGALFPIAEMHSRWFALLMSGKLRLPSPEKMLRDIKRKHDYLQSRYYGGPRNTLQVDWINYMDELATLIGCRPSVSSYLLKDPRLWWKLVFGPCFPYQYRLQGPHKWAEARDCILQAADRIKAPLVNTRELTDKNNQFLKNRKQQQRQATAAAAVASNGAASNGLSRNGYKKIE